MLDDADFQLLFQADKSTACLVRLLASLRDSR
jgi:hypothetical protein